MYKSCIYIYIHVILYRLYYIMSYHGISYHVMLYRMLYYIISYYMFILLFSLSLYLYIYLSICLSLSLYIYIYIDLPIYLSIYIFLSLSLYIYIERERHKCEPPAGDHPGQPRSRERPGAAVHQLRGPRRGGERLPAGKVRHNTVHYDLMYYAMT